MVKMVAPCNEILWSWRFLKTVDCSMDSESIGDVFEFDTDDVSRARPESVR